VCRRWCTIADPTALAQIERTSGRCALAVTARGGFSGTVFMSDHVLVGAPVDQARRRLLAQVRRDDLLAAVAGAFADQDGPPVVGAAAAPDRKLVVHTLPSYLVGAVTVVPLRWSTGSTFGDHFPVMDANIELQQAEPGTSRLGLTGIYRPAPGQSNTTSGDQDDARTTIRHFLGRLAAILTTV
jgi:hypothetical protein